MLELTEGEGGEESDADTLNEGETDADTETVAELDEDGC